MKTIEKTIQLIDKQLPLSFIEDEKGICNNENLQDSTLNKIVFHQVYEEFFKLDCAIRLISYDLLVQAEKLEKETQSSHKLSIK